MYYSRRCVHGLMNVSTGRVKEGVALCIWGEGAEGDLLTKRRSAHPEGNLFTKTEICLPKERSAHAEGDLQREVCSCRGRSAAGGLLTQGQICRERSAEGGLLTQEETGEVDIWGSARCVDLSWCLLDVWGGPVLMEIKWPKHLSRLTSCPYFSCP